MNKALLILIFFFFLIFSYFTSNFLATKNFYDNILSHKLCLFCSNINFITNDLIVNKKI